MFSVKNKNIIVTGAGVASKGAFRPLTKSPAYCAGKAAITT